MGTPGATELLIVLAIVLLILGPKRLPALGRQLGGGMREFKDAITGSRGRDDAGPDAVEPGRGEEITDDSGRDGSGRDEPGDAGRRPRADDDHGETLDGQVMPERRPS